MQMKDEKWKTVDVKMADWAGRWQLRENNLKVLIDHRGRVRGVRFME
jgi:hypothetical protein